jgi:hypothetical protein
MPQEGEKVAEGKPLTRIKKKEEEVRVMIHLIQLGENKKT